MLEGGEPKAVFFFDIDGLSKCRKRVSSSTKKLISNEGRWYLGWFWQQVVVQDLVQPFKDNLGLILQSLNGQYILTHDKVLYQNQLPKSTVYNLIHAKHRREISLGTSTGLVGSNIISMGTSKFGQIVSRIALSPGLRWWNVVLSLDSSFQATAIETLGTTCVSLFIRWLW